jgi:SPP1 family predicted phage head-tail adaptor
MSYTINPGEMRTQITLQSPTISEDSGGAQSTSYANVSPNPTIWARWINSHGQEAVTSEALKDVQRATVTIRHRTDIKETWRVVKGGENWQILSIDPVRDQRRFVELIVERVKGSV